MSEASVVLREGSRGNCLPLRQDSKPVAMFRQQAKLRGAAGEFAEWLTRQNLSEHPVPSAKMILASVMP